MRFTPASETLEHATQQREAIARKLYDFETVQATIKQAATDGHNSCRIIQKTYVNLRNTKVAAQLIEKLKQAGFKCEWTEATQREDLGQRDALVTIVYHELLISWGLTVRRLLGPADEV